MRASRGRHAGYTQIDYTFPACNAPINAKPHYPPPGQQRGLERLLTPESCPRVGHLHTPHIQQYMLCILHIKEVSHYLQLSQGTHQGSSRGLVGDYPKVSAPGVRLLQPLCDKSPPFPGWGGVGLCIDRCISIVKPAGYTRDTHAQYACGKLTPAWPTEVFVL